MSIELEQYQLILLRRPPDPPAADPALDTAALQRSHVAFYEALRAAGHVVTNGPVIDQPDVTLRGIAIMACESVAAAVRIASDDPLVAGG